MAVAVAPSKNSPKLEESKDRLLKAASAFTEKIEPPAVVLSPIEEFDPSTIAPTVKAVKNSKKSQEHKEEVEIDGILQRLATENMAQLKIEEDEKPQNNQIENSAAFESTNSIEVKASDPLDSELNIKTETVAPESNEVEPTTAPKE